ncbi:MAG: DMT family transporter [Alphaproteobacteria bacterium]|jgi:small multidrug resistance pump|nr:SMR family transporter [Candidatus Jidaibacter sp.]
MNAYITLFIAIIAEVIATSALKASESFTKLIPSLFVILGYSIAFYCLSHTLKSMQTGIAYAIWSGLGIVLISIMSYFIYGQKLDLPAILGILLIISGVILINVFSDASI